jgi:hypothetical protein
MGEELHLPTVRAISVDWREKAGPDSTLMHLSTDEFIGLIDRCMAAERKVERVRPYVKHLLACPVSWVALGRCNCGLTALLAEKEEGEA